MHVLPRHRSRKPAGAALGVALCAGLLASSVHLLATEYFVGPAGKDTASGLKAEAAFTTIQHAVDVAQPGDTVTVLDGLYRESVQITRSGKPGAPVTIRSRTRWGAKILAIAAPANGFTIGNSEAQGVAYIMIQGFDLYAPGSHGCGVASSYKAHHLVIEGNYAHQCGSSGIELNDGDYRCVRNNVCMGNALLMHYCGSGISLYGLIKADDAPGFHSVVSGNVCCFNDNGPTTLLSDGNGIIIDDFRDTQKYHKGSPPVDVRYTGADTLVEGNLTFGNGGRGIHVFLSNNVTIINNTSVRNMTRQVGHGPESGEITVASSAHVRVVNNLAWTTSSPAGNPSNANNTAYLGSAQTGNESGEELTFQNNLSFDVNKPGAPSCKLLGGVTADFTAAKGNRPGVDPRLLKADDPALVDPKLAPQTDFAAYFAPQAGSPAVAAGVKVPGTHSANATFVDIGAFGEAGKRGR